ncbi:hypothetical protein TN98_21100 [Pantoea anthophila]|nr:hypothetical protein TN98_21100 [Pantoea anthophila]
MVRGMTVEDGEIINHYRQILELASNEMDLTTNEQLLTELSAIVMTCHKTLEKLVELHTGPDEDNLP